MASAALCLSYSPTGLNRRRLGMGITSWLESSSSEGSSYTEEVATEIDAADGPREEVAADDEAPMVRESG